MSTIDHETEAESLTLEPSQFDLSLHNAIVTIRNPATGDHRTFKVSSNRQGTRFVSLLTGPSNEADYTSFAIVGSGAYDKIAFTFKKYQAGPGDRPTAWEMYTRFINHPERYQRKFGFEYRISSRCRKCNRRITSPRSLAVGLGPECEKSS
jgi:hypothetical protein